MTGKTNNINLKILSYFNFANLKLQTLEIAVVYTILTEQSLILGGIKSVSLDLYARCQLFIYLKGKHSNTDRFKLVLLQDSYILSGTDTTPNTFTSCEGYLAYK